MKKHCILILCLFLIACSKQKNSVRFSEEQIKSLHLEETIVLTSSLDSLIHVDLNSFLKPQKYDFSSLVEDIKILSLETNDNSLISTIYRVLITNSNIYIYDTFKGGGLIIFDKDGKFIKRISNGPGPGELNRLYEIAYDKQKNELIAYVHSFLLFYTPSGEFIRQEKLPFGFCDFTIIPDGYVFKTLDRQGNGHLGNLEDKTILVTNKDFKVKSAFLHQIKSEIDLVGHNYLYNDDRSLTITERFTDTIYQYISEKNQLKAKYKLDYSNKKLPEIFLQGSKENFYHAIKHNNYYYFLGEFLENNSHSAFFLQNSSIGRKTIVYRSTQTGNLQGGVFAVYDEVNEVPLMSLPFAVSSDYFVACHYPNKNNASLSNSSILSKEDKIKLRNQKEEDNPVLVLYKLKNF